MTAVHAWPDLLRGGFVGVDIFFVVSGYLISLLIFRDLGAGQFSFRDFYARRVRRLFPALCIVLATCLVASVLLTFPIESREIGKHVLAGSLFASNIALWMEAGYFDATSESKPLLHLWSLGIEEQFYILWPLAAAMMFRWRRYLFACIVALLVLSFLLNVFWVVEKAKGTFFLLPTRAWELLIGAALAYTVTFGVSAQLHERLCSLAARTPWLVRHWRDVASWSGVILIAAALALLDKGKHFPGWWALLPTTGTVLLLTAGPRAAFNRHVLSHRVMVFYGSISYPLYLWHWPLLVFPMLMGFEMDNAMRVLVLTASVGLAALTMEFVERPLRSGVWGSRTAPALCTVMILIGLGGWALKASDGLVAKYPPSVQALARAEFGNDFVQYRPSRCFLNLEQGPEHFAPECHDRRQGRTHHALLWGDSHAASLFPGLQQWTDGGPRSTALSQFTKARCPPLATLPSGSSRRCQEANEFVMQTIRQEKPATVVLAGYWSLYGASAAGNRPLADELLTTVQALRAAGVAHVVVMGHLPTWTRPLPRVLLAAWRDSGEVPERTRTAMDPRALAMDRALGAMLWGPGATFISPYEELCDVKGCLASLSKGGIAHPMVLDESHLTGDGSLALIERSHALLFN